MTYREDPRVFQVKQIPMTELVHRLGISRLRPMGAELIGPCPLCGGRDRFGINLRSDAFQCRKCDLKGRDQIALIRGVAGLGFKDALSWACGDEPAEISEAERKRRLKRSEDVRREQNRYRQKAINAARAIWQNARPGHLGVVAAYMNARGIDVDRLPVPGVPAALRFMLDHPYVQYIDRKYQTIHRGPCMVAGILNGRDQLMAVHRTWVDAAPPHGKAIIEHQGQSYPAKLTRGSVKGGAIRLCTPEDASVLIMGEGIETTLTAMLADAVPGAAYWAGVSLGNMAGQMRRVKGVKHSARPEMADDQAFIPPAWVKRLVYIMDGDSDPKKTRASLECGLRRAMAVRPVLTGEIVHAGEGVDLNDLL